MEMQVETRMATSWRATWTLAHEAKLTAANMANIDTPLRAQGWIRGENAGCDAGVDQDGRTAGPPEGRRRADRAPMAITSPWTGRA